MMAISPLFSITRLKWTDSSSRARLVQNSPPGSSGSGVTKRSEVVWVDAMIIQANGMRLMMLATISSA